MKNWFHNLLWTDCDICGKEFRKRRGGGVSRRVVCSDSCWAEAWRQWIRPKGVEK